MRKDKQPRLECSVCKHQLFPKNRNQREIDNTIITHYKKNHSEIELPLQNQYIGKLTANPRDLKAINILVGGIK